MRRFQFPILQPLRSVPSLFSSLGHVLLERARPCTARNLDSLFILGDIYSPRRYQIRCSEDLVLSRFPNVSLHPGWYSMLACCPYRCARRFWSAALTSCRLIRWNVVDRPCNPVKDHVVGEPVDCLVSVFVDVGIPDPNRADVLILG